MCGIKRDKTTGKAKLDATGSPQPRCVANCTMLLERKPKDKKGMSAELASASGAELCGLLGHTAILYRAREKKPGIRLPSS